MKEIGGYFGLDENNGSEFYPDALAFNTARNCLRFLIRHYGIKRIAIPDYDCNAVDDAVKKENSEYYFYPVKRDLKPDISGVANTDWLYIVNYYGQNTEIIKKVIKDHNHVIVDNVQAFFSNPFEGVDNIYTCRKFFGVSDGAYLVPHERGVFPEYERLAIDKSEHRLGAVLGRYEDNASSHFSEYQEIEDSLDDLPVQKMSKVTHWLLRGVNYDQVASRRNANFSYLEERLHDINELSVQQIDGPYMYPLLIHGGRQIKKKLIGQKIFVSTLWPNVLDSCVSNSDAYYLASNLIPIPCDQRYDMDDMAIISDAVHLAIRG